MIDYYRVLGVKRTASGREIKSAYRRLARRLHPDVNGGSAEAAREFARINRAYRVLADPHERAFYDAQVERSLRETSVLNSNNPYARRARRVTAKSRLDEAVDGWIEDGRRQTVALQQAVFPTVSLFLSTFIVAYLRPKFWQDSGIFGRVIIVTLFVIGLWHLVVRLKLCFERFTYKPKSVIGSLFGREEKSEQPFSRWTAALFLVFGIAVSFGAGLYVAEHMHYEIFDNLRSLFDPEIRPALVLYPPIAVLIVDSLHGLASKID